MKTIAKVIMVVYIVAVLATILVFLLYHSINYIKLLVGGQ
jgi:hypothetical protein